MSWHRTVVTLLLVVTTILASLYVSTFEPETLSDPVPIPAVERASHSAAGNWPAVSRPPNLV